MFNLIIILLSTLNDEPKGSNNYKIAKYMIENMRDFKNIFSHRSSSGLLCVKF